MWWCDGVSCPVKTTDLPVCFCSANMAKLPSAHEQLWMFGIVMPDACRAHANEPDVVLAGMAFVGTLIQEMGSSGEVLKSPLL